jgi:hypothetical protein
MAMGRQDLMSNSSGSENPQDYWRQATLAVNALAEATRNLSSDYPATVESLRIALRSPEYEREALLLLSFLNVDFTLAVLDLLVSTALSHREALRVRQILGRVAHNDLEAAVPPVVWEKLKTTPDYDAYRRLAEWRCRSCVTVRWIATTRMSEKWEKIS